MMFLTECRNIILEDTICKGVIIDDNGNDKEITADEVVIATGRRGADWLEKQDSEDAVFEALCHIFWRRNGSSDSYMLHGAYNDVYHTAYQCVDTPIRLSHAGKIMDWMKKHATEPRDDILMGWVPSNDESLCKTMGLYPMNRVQAPRSAQVSAWNGNMRLDCL